MGSKLSSPKAVARVKRPLHRKRLYERLDATPERAIAWLIAAGGYGKTTLALNYARARGWSTLYLPIPHAGLSVGEFFYALREQARAVLGRSAEALPVLNPEYAAAPEVFARRFTTVLLEQIAGPAVLLIDDLHHLEPEDPLHGIIGHLAEAVPQNKLRIIIASRHEPPSRWAAIRSRGQVFAVCERQLAFDAEETETLLRDQGVEVDRNSGESFTHLQAGLGGWAAGLMLALEHWHRTGELSPAVLLQRSVDDWFLEEVYAPLPEPDRILLSHCALPSVVPEEVVAEATGLEDAPQRLARLVCEHNFIIAEGDTNEGLRYRLHDLFRDFLRRQATAQDDAETLTARCSRWGRLLWARGRWSDAAPLLIEAGDHEGLAEGLREVAGALIQTGRGDKLFGWLQALPQEIVQADPQLRLWLGMCLMLHDTAASRQLLESAWEELADQRAYIPMAIAWSGIVDSIWLEWAHVSLYDRWIDEFLRFEQEFREQLPPPLWFTVLRSMLAAVSYGRPLDPSLVRWEQEALSALSGDMPDTERVMLAGQLMYLNTWQFGRRAEATRVMAVMRGLPEVIERASPLAQCLWRTFTSLWALLFEADRETCLREAEIGRELIRSHGIGTWDDAVPPLHCALSFDDSEALEDWMTWFLRTDCKANRPFYDTFQAHFLAGRAWQRGNIHEAVGHARQSLQAAERHGSITIFAGFRAILAGLLAEAGEHREALREAVRARHIASGFPSDFLGVMMYLALARIPLHRGQPRRALPYLRRAFEAGDRQRMFFPLMIRSGELSTLCALALAEGITPDYARWLIRERKLAPPADPSLRVHWPFRCRIRVLGSFHVDIGVDTGDRAPCLQRRPRALLSALILAGPAGVAQDSLAARLWPDSAPDRALNSLHVTAHRVREQLQDPAALIAQGGQMRLNSERVWVDAWKFQELGRQPAALSNEALQGALALYGGALCLYDLDQMDLEIHQATLERAYVALATQLGERFEAEQPEDALEVYQRALTHARLHESLWAGALRCAAALGHAHELSRIHRQMRERFESELDMPPPPALETLYRSLCNGDPA